MTDAQVSIETLEAIMKAFNTHDLDAIMEFFADDCVFETSAGAEPWGQRLDGKAAVRAGLAARFAGIPDVQYDADRHWINGHLAVSEWLVHGTTTDGKQIRARLRPLGVPGRVGACGPDDRPDDHGGRTLDEGSPAGFDRISGRCGTGP